MRRIVIIGAGQSGLQLALGLQAEGYAVTVVSNRTPAEFRSGRVMSSQCMFDRSLRIERDLGLDFWGDEAPAIAGMRVQVAGPDGQPALQWSARLDGPALSVDQRVKHAAWLEAFSGRGGNVLIEEPSLSRIEELTRTRDLVIIASGKSEVSGLFPRDAERSPFTSPRRALALTYVRGMEAAPPYSAVSVNLIPGVGEYFTMPALTTSGPCDIMVFEGIPGGPLDCWADVDSPAAHLARSREILERWLPWEAARCQRVELTDANGILTGRFAPTVRQPVGRLPSGAAVLGLGDTLVLNDPITGQGANNACKAADVYLTRILAHGDRPFDEPWMQGTFDRFWDYARWVTGWTNAMLLPPPPHVLQILGAAAEQPGIASAFANGFDHPPSLFPWIADPEAAGRFIAAGGRRELVTAGVWP